MRTTLLYILLFFCSSNYTIAQQNNSPYSIIGIGDIEKSYFDRTSGLGHAGLALSSGRNMYNANPAANAALDFHYFNMELATRFQGITYSGSPVTSSSSSSSDLQFRKLVLAVKPKPFWATTFGILPFSTAKYSMFGLKAIQGTNQSTPAYYQGDGGTNQIFLTNSFKIDSGFAKGLSIGIQSSYIFGHLNEQESILGNVGDSSLSTTRYITISNPYFKFGLQYKTKLNKNWNIAFGATGSYKTKLNADYSLQVVSGNTLLRSDYVYKSTFFTLPVSYGGGIALTTKDKYTFVADYNFQGWTSLNNKGISYTLVNSTQYSVGAEYSNKIRYRDYYGNFGTIEKYFLQAGFFYRTSYLKINGYQLDEVGGTLGGGFQLSGSFGLNAALEIGRRGTTQNGLIKENYTQFTLTLCYRDFWRSRKLIRFD